MTDEEFRKEATPIKADKEAPVVMIAATDDAKYDNLVNILDEMQICNVSKYSIMDFTPLHASLIKPYDK